MILAVVVVFALVGYFVWDPRYQGLGAFRPTGEVFRDPTSGKVTRAFEDPLTGQCQCREEP